MSKLDLLIVSGLCLAGYLLRGSYHGYSLSELGYWYSTHIGGDCVILNREARLVMANSRWSIDRPKRGSHVVRDRESREVIGSITPYRKAGRDIQYLATRVDEIARDFNLRFDAAYWLMARFDTKQEEKQNGQNQQS